MGVFTQKDWEGTRLVLSFLTFLFTGAVLRSVQQVTSSMTAEENEDEGTSTCSLTRCRGWRLSLLLTKASVACFCVGCLFGILCSAHSLFLCRDCALDFAMRLLCLLFCLSGYGLILAAHFERLRLTFKGSAMQLPQWAPKALRSSLLLLFALICVGSVARFSKPKIAAISVALCVVIYLAVTGLTMHAFYNKTVAAANSTPPDAQLLEVAVRITLVVGVSALSTVMSFLVQCLILSLCHTCYFWAALSFLPFFGDMCLSAFCLLCTFSAAAVPYKHVFGRMHDRFLAHVCRTMPSPLSLRPTVVFTIDCDNDL